MVTTHASDKETTVFSGLIDLDFGKVVCGIGKFVTGYVSAASSRGVVIGLSGGLDSSVAAKLCTLSLGKDRVCGLILPSSITPKRDIDDAIDFANELGIKHKVIDIRPILDRFMEVLPADKRAEGNLAARVRMSILYHFAYTKKNLVVGTSDKSELYIGYFTKFGDGGADLLPIADLYKIQVRALGRFLGLPPNILEKKSSPQLWKDHLAEEELGITYETLDPILHLLVDVKLTVRDAAKQLGVPISQVKKVQEMMDRSAHKRNRAAIAFIHG
nr:NAD+ synthetase [uncultured archaeon]